MIEYFRPEVGRENALDHGERDFHTAVTPSKLGEVLQTEHRAALSVFCFADGGVEVMVEGVDEVLSSRITGCVQSYSEPEDGEWSVNEVSCGVMKSTNSRASLAKAVPSSLSGFLNAFINESAITRAPLLPSSSL